MPLGFCVDCVDTSSLSQQLALARVRKGPRIGLLTDAFSIDDFAHTLIDNLRQQHVLDCPDGKIHFRSNEGFRALQWAPGHQLRRPTAEQSNSSLIVNDTVIMKVIRHISAGINPELEIAQYLTNVGYSNAPKFYGDVTYIDNSGKQYTQILAQSFVHNQGDAWQWTLDRLSRALQQTNTGQIAVEALPVENANPIEELAGFASILGHRLGELHNALALPTNDPAFAPEPSNDSDIAAWEVRVVAQYEMALKVLADQPNQTSQDLEAFNYLVAHHDEVLSHIHQMVQNGKNHLRTRIHGDFHLGQVLVISGDVMIIDFEGEPGRTMEERRHKDSPLRDVAGTLRSFSYAAAFVDRNELNQNIQQDERDRLLRQYLEASKASFMQAYCQARANTGAGETISIPVAQHGSNVTQEKYDISPQLESLLQLFSLERVSYEVVYEATHRPAWVDVPLRSLRYLVTNLLGNENKPYASSSATNHPANQ